MPRPPQPGPPQPSPSNGIRPPDLLVRQLREGRVVLFVGAGLSAQAGLPTWRALLKDVVEATIQETHPTPEARAELGRMLEDGKLLEIADHCKDRLGPGGYTSFLAERLADAGRPVPEVHRLAMRLPFAAWVTTNYDKLLERAFAETRGGLPKTLTSRDTEALGRLLFDSAPFILKAHGDLDKPDSLVFTSRDYRDLIHGNAAFSTAFSAILLTHSLLFVGYSLGDPDFNLLMDRQLLTFRGFVPERYAIMGGLGKVEEEYLWRVGQIRVIPYPQGQHGFVPRFLEALALAVGREALSTPRAAPAPPPVDTLAYTTSGLKSGEGPVALSPGLGTSKRRAKPKRSTVGGRPRPTAALSAKAPSPTRPPLRLLLDWKDGAVQSTLQDPDGSVMGPVAGPAARWSTVITASRDPNSAGPSAHEPESERRSAMEDLLDPGFLRAFEKALRRGSTPPVELVLARAVERLPWEFLPVGSKTLARSAAVFRAPVDVSSEARGTPAVASRLRALVIGNPSADLPGAAEEAREVARAIQAGGFGEAKLLMGVEATVDAVRAEVEARAPDILHFAGHAWYDEHEAFLFLSDGRLTASMLRPWLTREPPAFLFLNSHFTSFIPPGVEHAAPSPTELAIHAGPGGRDGFADVAMRGGVSSLLGAFSGAITDDVARRFAVSVYQALLQGRTAAEAVRMARDVPAGEGDLTAQFYSLHGDGGLRLTK